MTGIELITVKLFDPDDKAISLVKISLTNRQEQKIADISFKARADAGTHEIIEEVGFRLVEFAARHSGVIVK